MANLAKILASPVTDLVDKVLPDVQETRDAQVELAKTDAQSEHLFVAGWRPFIGWVFGAIFLWNFIIAPFLVWVSALLGATIPNVPSIPLDAILPVLVGLLGLGGLRTIEKIRR